MPPRAAPKCSRRSCRREHLEQTVELCLVWGHCFGFADLRTRAEFARPWSTFGPEIIRRWTAAYPGSRPMAAYVLGEIEPWSWTHRLPGLRHPLPLIRDVDVVVDLGGHMGPEEFDHLDDLGLLSARERAAAIERLASSDARSHRRYSELAALKVRLTQPATQDAASKIPTLTD